MRYLTDTEAGNGFANRFLWVCVKRSKLLPEWGGVPDYNQLVQPLHDALERAQRMGRLERDAAAKEAWAEIYPEMKVMSSLDIATDTVVVLPTDGRSLPAWDRQERFLNAYAELGTPTDA